MTGRDALAAWDMRRSRIKETILLSSIIGERVSLRRDGRWFRGCCPFHDDSTPSFWVSDETGCYGCFGCDAQGDVFNFLIESEGCTFGEAMDLLDQGYVATPLPRKISRRGDEDEAVRIERARRIWVNGSPIKGTVAETYLANRALRLENLPDPLNLRFAHLSFDGSVDLFPALVAAIRTAEGEFAGIQRTFLTEDGRKLHDGNSKRSLGVQRGNAIHIADQCADYGLVYLCEGLETGLSLSRMYGDPVMVTAGAGSMASVSLPKECRVVMIGADNDPVGIKAAEHAASVFGTRGIETYILRPVSQFNDWNDHLQFWDTHPYPDDLPAEVEWVRG